MRRCTHLWQLMLLVKLSAAALFTTPAQLFDSRQGIKMGVASDQCDDAKTRLEVDWDGSPQQYTCFLPFKQRLAVLDLEPREHCDNVPDNYYPQHFCMDHRLVYNETIPTHGDHRPLWAVFGEYRYLPPQRWLHNVEHGSVVMLYHPCADPQHVEVLRSLVTGCIRKHVITPHPGLSPERPLALVAWGCRLEMAHVQPDLVRAFIRRRALHGPEGDYAKQGQYSYQLVRPAQPPPGSDLQDSVLCPDTSVQSIAIIPILG